jgi:hypothetical protein
MEYVLRCLKRAADNSYAWSVTPAEAGALVAEVERLRAEVSYLRACVPPTRPTDYGHEVWTAALRAEVKEERAATVAWLREPGEYVDTACARLADCIERGQHRRKGEP